MRMALNHLKRKAGDPVRALANAGPPKQRVKMDKTADKRANNMLDDLSITWLGTSSAAPCKTRNTSSSAIKLDGELWVVDVGEATQHQVQRSKLKITNATKIFLTHMHGDHVFGLVPFLCALADGAGGLLEGMDWREREALRSPPIDIYGLTGTRRLIRTTLECTYTKLARRYRVHELLFENDPIFEGKRHRQEMPGSDIRIGPEGYWPDILFPEDKMQACAVPIKHSVPCVGFVFKEHPRLMPIDPKVYAPHLERNVEALMKEPWNLKQPKQLLGVLQRERKSITLPDGHVLEPPSMSDDGRKLVILGDTYDAISNAMDKVAMEPDLLVHESTNAFLPGLDDTVKEEDTYEALAAKTRSHGHSTPQVAGAFAQRVRARTLFLNHLSARYVDAGSTLDGKAPINITEDIAVVDQGVERKFGDEDGDAAVTETRMALLREIEKQASAAFGEGKRAIVTRDFMTVRIKRRKA